MEFTISFSGNKKVIAQVGEHSIVTDQPVFAGGDNEGPSPFSLFLASLGTCAGIYIKSFCDQRGIPTENIKIIQKHNFNPSTQMIEQIDLTVELPNTFPQKYKDAVIKAADGCAVKKHLHNPPLINVKVS
jgi:ribosomal protein S12 methylthiotransferase accessory factor